MNAYYPFETFVPPVTSTPTPTVTPTATPSGTLTPTPTQEPTATPAATFTYDANGNMLSDGVKCMQYNEANQLDKVKECESNQTIAEYVYDYNGNRMVKRNFSAGVLSNTVVSWSDSYETKVIVGGSTENTAYYWVNGQLIGKKDHAGSRTYMHNDHLGSNSLVTDASGAAVQVTTYDPWGVVKSGGTASKFLYTGQEKDAETGLHYYNARYYDADIRRFTQPDPWIQDVYDPQSLNRYSYVRNNPLRYTDPTGHFWGVLVSIVKTIWRPVVNYVAKVAPSLPFIGPVIQKATNHPTVQQTVQKAQPVINKVQSNPVVQQVTRDPVQQQAQSIQQTVSTVKSAAQQLPQFASQVKLQDHFGRHAGRLGLDTVDDYINGARKLFEGGTGVEGAVRGSDGALGFFKPLTGEFGILDKTGSVIKTYFKPKGDPVEYWHNRSSFFK